MKQSPIGWILLLVVWGSNINDLIRGEWFFQSTTQILFWNSMGIIGFALIVLAYREEIKELSSQNTGFQSKEKNNG